MSEVPDYVGDLSDDEVQPWVVRRQGEFVAIIQRDGANDQIHWVLIPLVDMDSFYSMLVDAEEK